MTITFRSPIKRHYTLAEVQQQMAQDIEPARPTSITEFLRKDSIGANFGNTDASDLKPPQLKLLAGQSPGSDRRDLLAAVPGNFWLTILNLNLGQSVGCSARPSCCASPIRSGRRKRRDQTRRDRSRSRPTASTGTSRIRVSRSGSPAIRGSTLGGLAAPSPEDGRTQVRLVAGRTTRRPESPSPHIDLRRSVGHRSAEREQASNCACSRPRARAWGKELLRTSSRATKAQGI